MAKDQDNDSSHTVTYRGQLTIEMMATPQGSSAGFRDTGVRQVTRLIQWLVMRVVGVRIEINS